MKRYFIRDNKKNKFLLQYILIIIFFAVNVYAEFTHPGLLNNMEELNFMREKILAHEEPWASGYAQIPDFLEHTPQPVEIYKDGKGHSDPEDIIMQHLRDDGMAAYGSALHWIVTGDEAHALKVIEILDAWSTTLKKIDAVSISNDDVSLSTGYCWPNHIYAAEIIRATYENWSQESQLRFKNMLLDLVWPALQIAEDKSNNNNWKSLAIFCRTTIAIYTNNQAKYEYALAKLREQIPTYCYPSGQCIETARDLWHSQMGIAPLVAAAEMVWHQGEDVYATGDNRLLTAVEWHIPFIMKSTAGWPSEFDSPYYPPDKPDSGGGPWPFYELVYNHYHNRMGLETPNTWKILTQSVAGEKDFPVRPELWSRTGGWGTATHIRHDLMTSVTSGVPSPTHFELLQNFPNPFNPTTAIRYELPKESKVVVKIYNHLGQEIRSLVNGFQSAGEKTIMWDGLDERGQKAPSGIYIYQMKTGAVSVSRKMVLMR